MEQVKQLALEEGLQDQIETVEAGMEALPLKDQSIDLIWCKDSLSHSTDIHAALKEMKRVLKPGGQAVVYTAINNPTLPETEAICFEKVLGNKRRSMDKDWLYSAIMNTNMQVEVIMPLDSEESAQQEAIPDSYFDRVKHLAKLIRHRKEAEAIAGKEVVDHYEALCLFSTYALIGKISYWLVVLRNT